jgi:GNAT superfamily N-acetyltransferase
MTDSRGDIFIQAANLEQAETISDILADAFQADPVITWVSADSACPKVLFAQVLPLFLPYGQVYLTSDRQGAALWLPPGVMMKSPITIGSAFRYVRRFGVGSMRRLSCLLMRMGKNHPTEKHYYLFAIGVRSGAQGRGIGSALLRHVLPRCDREQVPAYLENTNAQNLPLYLRHGFEVLQELALPSAGPKLWLMLRQPRVNNAAPLS